MILLVDGIRRIGETGPIYQVLGRGASTLRGRPSLQVEFLESGEVIDYPLIDVRDDPLEARSLR